MLKRLRGWLTTPTGKLWEQLAVTFIATDAVTLYFNGEHVLAERGLDGLKAQVPSLLVAAAVAGWHKTKPGVKAALDRLLGP